VPFYRRHIRITCIQTGWCKILYSCYITLRFDSSSFYITSYHLWLINHTNLSDLGVSMCKCLKLFMKNISIRGMLESLYISQFCTKLFVVEVVYPVLYYIVSLTIWSISYFFCLLASKCTTSLWITSIKFDPICRSLGRKPPTARGGETELIGWSDCCTGALCQVRGI
jgi:hypothetical protein